MINCTEPTGCIKEQCMHYDSVCIVTLSGRNKNDVIVKIFTIDDIQNKNSLFTFYEELKDQGFRKGNSPLVMIKDGMTYTAKWYELCSDTGDVNEM